MKSFVLLALSALLAACSPVVTSTTCDKVCTMDTECSGGESCLDTSTPNVRRCLPSLCKTCPIGKCALDLDTCGNAQCNP
jgi:hypothetical protein